MGNEYVLGIDVGGSHVACQLVCTDGFVPVDGTYTEVKVAENESAEVLLAAWKQALDSCCTKAGGRKPAGIGVAIPSPFDFMGGIAMADHKFAALKGMDIRKELSGMSGVAENRILFTNDAAAFGMGIWRLDGGRDRHTIGVTLGTGFGACFIADGCYTTYGPGVPGGGELWNYPYRGVIAEDFVSTRWFEKRFKDLCGETVKGLKGVVDFYEAGRYKAETEQIFQEFSASFCEIMSPFMKRFKADKLVIGGGMVLSGQYFLPLIEERFRAEGIMAAVESMADTTAAIITGAAALCE